MHATNAAFLLLVVLSVGFFALNVQRLISYLRIGRLPIGVPLFASFTIASSGRSSWQRTSQLSDLPFDSGSFL